MNIYITDTRRTQLKEFSKKHKKSMSHVIDKALQKYFSMETIEPIFPENNDDDNKNDSRII